MPSLRNPWSSPRDGGALHDPFSNSTKMVDLLPMLIIMMAIASICDGKRWQFDGNRMAIVNILVRNGDGNQYCNIGG